MESFRDQFAGDLASTISEVSVGSGPCGELRQGGLHAACRVVHRIVYWCSPRQTPHSVPVLATSSTTYLSVPVLATTSTT